MRSQSRRTSRGAFVVVCCRAPVSCLRLLRLVSFQRRPELRCLVTCVNSSPSFFQTSDQKWGRNPGSERGHRECIPSQAAAVRVVEASLAAWDGKDQALAADCTGDAALTCALSEFSLVSVMTLHIKDCPHHKRVVCRLTIQAVSSGAKGDLFLAAVSVVCPKRFRIQPFVVLNET